MTAAASGQLSRSDEDQRVVPRIRRARPQDAVEVALETFTSGERLDMQTLAAQLDVSPATLHRWFGSRAQLLDRVCEHLAEEFGSAALAQAQGDGDERVCDYARRVITAGLAFEPVRVFVSREPQLAMRLLLGKGGGVHRVVTEQMRAIIAVTRTAAQAQRLQESVDLIAQVATSLVWTTFIIGEDPQVEDAVKIVRMILASSRAR